jgi:hypothetical protein
MNEDLKQYMTNLLYYAHNYEHAHNNTNSRTSQEFDEWVEEMITGIDEYFKSVEDKIEEPKDYM